MGTRPLAFFRYPYMAYGSFRLCLTPAGSITGFIWFVLAMVGAPFCADRLSEIRDGPKRTASCRSESSSISLVVLDKKNNSGLWARIQILQKKTE